MALLKRTVSSIFLLLILIFSVILSKENGKPILVFILTNIIVAFGLLDFMYITNRHGSKLLRTYGVIAGIFLNTFLFLRFFFNRPADAFMVKSTMLILMIMFFIQILRQETKLTIHGICTTMTGIIYVVWMFSYMIRINYIHDVDGRWLICVFLVITKSSDIFAYLIGSNFGRHKLIPKISPGKTVEGSIGGILGSIVVAVIILRIVPVPEIMVRHSVIIGFSLGFFGQLGDLAESMLKRNGDVKDSGEYIPGMGGILDLLDSVLLAAPIMYYYLYYFVGIS